MIERCQLGTTIYIGLAYSRPRCIAPNKINIIIIFINPSNARGHYSGNMHN